jgi:hypothetical protein
MAVELVQEAGGQVLRVRITEELAQGDYALFVPEIERLIAQYGKVRLLVEMVNFRGWTAGALWQDIKFDVKHFRDIERLALVGEKRWQKNMAAFCKPFTSAEIRYFDRSETNLARAWVEEGVAAIRQ